MKKDHNIITIDVELRHETDRAYLISVGDKFGGTWVPKTLCEYSDGELQIPDWLAEDKGLV